MSRWKRRQHQMRVRRATQREVAQRLAAHEHDDPTGSGHGTQDRPRTPTGTRDAATTPDHQEPPD